MAAHTPPVARREQSIRTHHGHEFVDHYEWLREKESPEVIAHLEAENAHTEAETAHLAELREQIYEEIESRTQQTDLSVPVRQGSWWYYTRTSEGSSYGIHCRVAAADDDWVPPTIEPGAPLEGEQVLLDGNAEAEGHEFFALGSFDVSDDGTRLLYGIDVTGDERYTLRVRELATGEDLPETIENTAGGASFDVTGRYVFYTTVDDAWRPDTVWRHEIGAEGDDVVVHHEADESFWVGVGVTRSRRYLLLSAGSSVTTEIRMLDASDPTGEFRVVWPRREGVEYEVEHAVVAGEDRLLIVHNEGAESDVTAANFALDSVAASDPAGERVTLLPADAERRLEGVDAFADYLVVEYREGALPRVGVIELGEHGPGPLAEIGVGEVLGSLHAGGNPEWRQPVIRLGYSSFVTPSTVYDYDVASRQLRMLKRQPVLGGHDPALYRQRRVWAEAHDGTAIPVSLVWRGDLVAAEEGAPAEPAPTLLYGYGSYEHSIDPGFSIARLSLLDRGVVFAVAHVRGGGEMGRAWYDDGKKLAKRNSFTDFVDVARHLIETGWTEPGCLVAEGRSAGGLLMGAVANLAPELFAGVLAGVPFVDALTSILDPSLPLTVIEWDEWGDPLHDPEVYSYMRTYSPYENVRDDVRYPRILATTSLHDTRVLYVEPAKWVARLREVGAPALLKTEMSAGHGGASGRYDAWRERAFELAWVLDVLGVHAGQRLDPVAGHPALGNGAA